MANGGGGGGGSLVTTLYISTYQSFLGSSQTMLNHSDGEATFPQSRRTQRFLKSL